MAISHTYESLTGARGRRVLYRAKRHKADDVFSKFPPTVAVDAHQVTLCDLSMSGFAAYADDSEMWSGAEAASVSVRMDLGGETVFEGRARLCRVEPSPLGVKIALNLTDSYLDIGKIAAAHRNVSLDRAFDQDLSVLIDRIDPEYRRLAADVLYMLRHYRRVLDGIGSAADDDRLEDLLATCEERVLPRWRALWHRANELVAPLMTDSEARKATKRFTELVLTPDMLPGPIWARSYRKPLGYPGDYQMMNQVYAWQREGATPYAKLLHRLGLDVAECIATRMAAVRGCITAALEQGHNGRPIRVMTLGCGPAQEVHDALSCEHLPNPAAFTLIDQEQDALTDAYERIYPLSIKHGGRATLRCLHASFAQMMKADEIVTRTQPQDLIYSMGLVDYLNDRRARELTAALYHRLAPGGRLVIGNMKDTPTGNLWPLEFVCDWSLNYRDKTRMHQMVAGLNSVACEVQNDPTERIYLLDLRAP